VTDLNQKNRANSNGRGGARPGAGRKKNAVTMRTQEIKNRIIAKASKGTTPLEVMLKVMAGFWAMAIKADNSLDPLERKAAPMLMMLAVKAAKHAAPYVHPRRTAVKVSGDWNSQTPAASVVHLTVEKQLPTSGVVILPAGMSVEQFEKAALEA
jgi:hypothetical protein